MRVMSKYENSCMFGRGRLRVKGNERLLIVYLGLMYCVKSVKVQCERVLLIGHGKTQRDEISYLKLRHHQSSLLYQRLTIYGYDLAVIILNHFLLTHSETDCRQTFMSFFFSAKVMNEALTQEKQKINPTVT